MTFPRLDILIYAHDGRGLGHVSRSLGIGMALRRLYPELKVLFVSGSEIVHELLGEAPLDWLKLPAYKTKVIEGKSCGVHGNSMYGDDELGVIRSHALLQIVDLYNPKLVLVDHTPQGKHKELVPSIWGQNAPEEDDIKWVLGVRGVVGSVKQSGSELARQLFSKRFQALFWYGDSVVLGNDHCQLLESQYGVTPKECGYVVRAAEFLHWNNGVRESFARGEKCGGTVAIPWLGENSVAFLHTLATVLEEFGNSYGVWNLFVDLRQAATDENVRAVTRKLKQQDHITLSSPGREYLFSLLHSKVAVIYGGYNSIMDVLYANIPSVVVLREMRDAEQQIHLKKLQAHGETGLETVLESSVSTRELREILLKKLHQQTAKPHTINIDGAAETAHHLVKMICSD